MAPTQTKPVTGTVVPLEAKALTELPDGGYSVTLTPINAGTAESAIVMANVIIRDGPEALFLRQGKSPRLVFDDGDANWKDDTS